MSRPFHPSFPTFSLPKCKANEDVAEAKEVIVSPGYISPVTNLLLAPVPRFELPLLPPPLYPSGGPKSRARGAGFTAVTASEEHYEHNRSPRNLIGELELSDLYNTTKQAM